MANESKANKDKANKTEAPVEVTKGKDAAAAATDATATPPAENEKEQAERAAALEKALAATNKTAGKIAADWSKADKAQKTWMVEMGGRCHAWLLSVVALGTPYSVAMSQLVTWLIATTGENKGSDVSRCVRLYFASLVFGAAQFAKLSIRGQKEIATLLQGSDDEQGATAYTLTPSTADQAKAIFAFACGDDKRTIEGFDRAKDGTIIGEGIAKLVAAVKQGRKPLEESKEQAAAAAKKAKENANADKAKKEQEAAAAAGATEGQGGQGGKGQEETAAANVNPAPAPALDVKPAIAAGQLVKLLAEHDDSAMVLHSAARAKEFTVEMVLAILTAFSEAGKIPELRQIVTAAGKEVYIAVTMEQHKATRIEALKIIEKQDAQKRAG